MSYKIDPNKCVSCAACVDSCQFAAIAPKDGKFKIDPAMCQSCGACAAACPMCAIATDTGADICAMPTPNTTPKAA